MSITFILSARLNWKDNKTGNWEGLYMRRISRFKVLIIPNIMITQEITLTIKIGSYLPNGVSKVVITISNTHCLPERGI